MSIAIAALVISVACASHSANAQSEPTPDTAKRLAYGRHLASECTACHRIDGVDNGIPSITGWPVAVFVETMGYYKAGTRPNQIMISVARSLDDEQLHALATFYASLPKRPRSK